MYGSPRVATFFPSFQESTSVLLNPTDITFDHYEASQWKP